MKQHTRVGWWWVVTMVGIALSFPARSFSWDEETFFALDKIVARPFILPQKPNDLEAQTVIGFPKTYILRKKDTLLDVARYFDLGFNEISGAYPEIDPWLPPPGDELSVPTWWVLPKSGNAGIVVNIPEMRLYYFPPLEKRLNNRVVITLPVGLGREDWPTPRAKFKVAGKTLDPIWVIPDSIKEERIKENGWSEEFIPADSPDNPMGKYRIDLSLPLYKIHDTNNPWAVGRLVTHGCIRMYPEDIAQFFDIIRIGVPGEFVYQPVKIGVLYGKVYVEVHEDIYKLVPDLWAEAQKVVRESGYEEMVDSVLLTKALMQKNGLPTDITKGSQRWKALNGEVTDLETEELNHGTKTSHR